MKHRIRQIEEGLHYRGRIEIGKGAAKFDIQLESRLKMGKHIDHKDVRSLKIEKDGQELQKPEARNFFELLIFRAVAQMHNDPLIRGLNKRVKKANDHAHKESVVKHSGKHSVRILIEFEQIQRESAPFTSYDLKILNDLGFQL